MQLATVRRYGWAALVLLVAAFGVFRLRGQGALTPPAQPTAVAAADPGTALGGTPAPNFTLTANNGSTVRLSDFRGKVVLLPFIDSKCTTVCPLTAAVLEKVQETLGRQASAVQLLAVNVNPLYTSVADVEQWSQAHGMSGHWLFVTGSDRQMAPVWADYHVWSEVADGSVMHTAAIYVIDPQGREQWVFTSDLGASLDAQAQRIVARIRPLLP